MSVESINFDGKNINKSNFYKNKKLLKIKDIDINKILVSKKESYGKKNSLKYFIGYNDDDVIRPLCNNKLLKKYNRIWEKISNLMNIEFDSEPVYGDNHKYIKPRIKLTINGDVKINKKFSRQKNTKRNASYKCLTLIMLVSVTK